MLLFAYDCYYSNNLPDHFKNYLTYISDIKQREMHRSCIFDCYFLPPQLKATYNTIRLAASAFWNKIPSDIRGINFSRSIFKNKIKKWLISKYEDNTEILN